jgi:hypothetical protein
VRRSVADGSATTRNLASGSSAHSPAPNTQRLTPRLGRNHLQASGTLILENDLVGSTSKSSTGLVTLTSSRVLSLGPEVPQFPCPSQCGPERTAPLARVETENVVGRLPPCLRQVLTRAEAGLDVQKTFRSQRRSSSRSPSPVTQYHINVKRQGDLLRTQGDLLQCAKGVLTPRTISALPYRRLSL